MKESKESKESKRSNGSEKELGRAAPPPDGSKAVVVYRDERYTLGLEGGQPYLSANGARYVLSCHPYEPCLYVADERGGMTAVHNAFDPLDVLECFADGKTVASITGREYDAKDFCRMVEYAAGLYDVQIDEAEKVFHGRAKEKTQKPEKEPKKKEKTVAAEKSPRPEFCRIIEDDPFCELIAGYPDAAVDYCLVANEHIGTGLNAHRDALLRACRKLFVDENDEAIWHFDVGKADGKLIPAKDLFALPEELRTGTDRHPTGDASRYGQVTDGGSRPYWQAFLMPPGGRRYTADDFREVNAALFPKGQDELEVFTWTTDWSDYFDEGREWWGTLCLTVYDKTLDRFVVIMASATD